MEEQVIENKDQKWFLSGLYFLEAMKEEQEETNHVNADPAQPN